MAKKKYYIGGKEYIPDDDYILCNVTPDNMDFYALSPQEYKRVYATKNGAFYYMEQGKKHTEVRMITKDEALDFLDENSAYICIANYDKIFGKPARG
jgi:hypothetical protein